MKTKKAFWISYDLGLRGDYSGLYNWLDSLGAKDCGDSLAFFKKEIDDENIIEMMKTHIQEYVKINSTDRIYLIYKDKKTNKIKGNFLFGGRKRSAWEGYSTGTNKTDDDTE